MCLYFLLLCGWSQAAYGSKLESFLFKDHFSGGILTTCRGFKNEENDFVVFSLRGKGPVFSSAGRVIFEANVVVEDDKSFEEIPVRLEWVHQFQRHHLQEMY
jgi:hypothetical protein